jgi:hypothetical protein
MHKKEKVARIVKAINEIKEQENEERGIAICTSL